MVHYDSDSDHVPEDDGKDAGHEAEFKDSYKHRIRNGRCKRRDHRRKDNARGSKITTDDVTNDVTSHSRLRKQLEEARNYSIELMKSMKHVSRQDFHGKKRKKHMRSGSGPDIVTSSTCNDTASKCYGSHCECGQGDERTRKRDEYNETGPLYEIPTTRNGERKQKGVRMKTRRRAYKKAHKELEKERQIAYNRAIYQSWIDFSEQCYAIRRRQSQEFATGNADDANSQNESYGSIGEEMKRSDHNVVYSEFSNARKDIAIGNVIILAGSSDVDWMTRERVPYFHVDDYDNVNTEADDDLPDEEEMIRNRNEEYDERVDKENTDIEEFDSLEYVRGKSYAVRIGNIDQNDTIES